MSNSVGRCSPFNKWGFTRQHSAVDQRAPDSCSMNEEGNDEPPLHSICRSSASVGVCHNLPGNQIEGLSPRKAAHMLNVDEEATITLPNAISSMSVMTDCFSTC